MHDNRTKASCVLSSVMFVLTPAEGLCCVWFIFPVLYSFWYPEIGTSSIDWAQLSRLLLDDGDRAQPPKCYLK
jgi:hypothetical protein